MEVTTLRGCEYALRLIMKAGALLIAVVIAVGVVSADSTAITPRLRDLVEVSSLIIEARLRPDVSQAASPSPACGTGTSLQVLGVPTVLAGRQDTSLSEIHYDPHLVRVGLGMTTLQTREPVVVLVVGNSSCGKYHLANPAFGILAPADDGRYVVRLGRGLGTSRVSLKALIGALTALRQRVGKQKHRPPALNTWTVISEQRQPSRRHSQ